MEIEPLPAVSTNPANSGVCHIITFGGSGYTAALAEYPFASDPQPVLPEIKPINVEDIGFGFARSCIARNERLHQAENGLLSTDGTSDPFVGTSLGSYKSGELVTFRRALVSQEA